MGSLGSFVLSLSPGIKGAGESYQILCSLSGLFFVPRTDSHQAWEGSGKEGVLRAYDSPIPPHAPRDRNPSGASKIHTTRPPPLPRRFPEQPLHDIGWVATASRGVTEAGMEHRAT